jgi:hypothetical protein
MGYSLTLAKIFDAKGLIAKILKARELARVFGEANRLWAI